MPKNLLLFLILFLSLSSPYAAEKEPVQGVWQGTIGNKTVVASFGDMKGRYFDTKYLKLIALAANNQDLYEWTEKVGEKTTAVWQLTNVDREHITGVWQNAENKQTYKITLTLTQSIPKSNYIDLNNLVQTYNKKFTYGKPTQFGEHQYRTIAFNNQVSNLELLDNAPNIKQLNNMLKFGLQAQISEHMDCASEAERQRGENAT